MTLAPGTRFGPYEVTASLGKGGMGEVYRARDTRLGRDVAVKVLPERVAADSEWRARFEREARAIAALNDPRICTVHDVGNENGVEYLVMEHLEGETLADRLARGPLPPDQVLRYGADIAAALAAAHRRGIVHRDLKPGNVMLTKAGVKLLDFGLAKTRAAVSSSASETPTALDQPLTGQGMLLGTVPYMAPEQIEGQEADERSDIWALGTVLYEMAAGRRAFDGKSHASLIGAILRDDPPPIQAFQPLAPHSLDRVVRGCVEKDPDERWQSAKDIERELRWIVRGEASVPVAARTRARSRTAAALAAILLAGAVLGWLLGALRSDRPAGTRADQPLRRLSIVLPEHAALAPASATPFNYLRPSFDVSPDGSRLVYVTRLRDGRTQLYLRRADGFEPTPIPGTEGGFDPFFSPDGEWVGFFTFDALLKVSLRGGAPLTLTAAVNPAGATWCDNGAIYYAATEGQELREIKRADTARPESPVPIPLESAFTSHPRCLPGSTGLLLTTVGSDGATGVPSQWPLSADYAAAGVLPLPATERRARVLIGRGYAPAYSRSGHIVFARGGSLMAAPFDLRTLRVTGSDMTVVEGVRMSSVSIPAAQFSITRGGDLVYVPGGDHSRTQLVWVDRSGQVTTTAAAPNLFGIIQVSPDGRRAAVEVGGLQNDVYVYELADGRRIRLTSDGNGGGLGIWHPDARRVAFYAELKATSAHGVSTVNPRLVLKQVEGVAPPEPLPLTDTAVTSWTAGNALAGTRDRRIWVGTLDRQTTITTTGSEWGATLSRDAAFVAYTSARTGTFQVFAQPVPATGEEWQVSSDFGEEPVWSRTSRDLFYRRHNQWWSVSFAAGRPGAPQLMFEGPFFNAFGPSYDVAPDGRFLMALPPGAGDAIRELLWIDGWSAELAAKVSRGR